MKLEVTFEDVDRYLLAKVKGEWTPDAISEAIQTIANTTQKRKYTRVLIDALELSAPETDFHRYLAGEDLANYMGLTIRIAVVYPQKLINKFTENTAVNRGVQIMVLSNIDEALLWLMEGPVNVLDETSGQVHRKEDG